MHCSPVIVSLCSFGWHVVFRIVQCLLLTQTLEGNLRDSQAPFYCIQGLLLSFPISKIELCKLAVTLTHTGEECLGSPSNNYLLFEIMYLCKHSRLLQCYMPT